MKHTLKFESYPGSSGYTFEWSKPYDDWVKRVWLCNEKLNQLFGITPRNQRSFTMIVSDTRPHEAGWHKLMLLHGRCEKAEMTINRKVFNFDIDTSVYTYAYHLKFPSTFWIKVV